MMLLPGSLRIFQRNLIASKLKRVVGSSLVRDFYISLSKYPIYSLITDPPANKKDYALTFSSFTIENGSMPQEWPLSTVLISNRTDQQLSVHSLWLPTALGSQNQGTHSGTHS